VLALRRARESIGPEEDREYSFWKQDIVITNCGSVGQPRDGEPRGCFAILDDIKRQITFHRFDYDIGEARKKS
jgi:diadenosine tetraphosphatase ApaH/serine/threonine PP2A family protein phosphatase